jgi:hypothetical protein
MEIGKPTTVDVKEPANEGQIGGNHYKKLQIQPWDYILANNIGYCEASAIKYLSRWKDKGGIADLYKAKHFIDKLIEHEGARRDYQTTLRLRPERAVGFPTPAQECGKEGTQAAHANWSWSGKGMGMKGPRYVRCGPVS